MIIPGNASPLCFSSVSLLLTSLKSSLTNPNKRSNLPSPTDNIFCSQQTTGVSPPCAAFPLSLEVFRSSQKVSKKINVFAKIKRGESGFWHTNKKIFGKEMSKFFNWYYLHLFIVSFTCHLSSSIAFKFINILLFENFLLLLTPVFIKLPHSYFEMFAYGEKKNTKVSTWGFSNSNELMFPLFYLCDLNSFWQDFTSKD